MSLPDDETVLMAASESHQNPYAAHLPPRYAQGPRRTTCELIELWSGCSRAQAVGAILVAAEAGLVDYAHDITRAWPAPVIHRARPITRSESDHSGLAEEGHQTHE